jgi:hypothetical protein
MQDTERYRKGPESLLTLSATIWKSPMLKYILLTPGEGLCLESKSVTNTPLLSIAVVCSTENESSTPSHTSALH